MHLTGLDRLLWAASLAGHCVLLTVLCVCRRAATFPVFTSLITVNILRTVILYCVLRFATSESYFYTYWTLGICDVAIQIAIAYEVASLVFRPLGVWAPDVRRSFAVWALASVLGAFGLTWLSAPPTRTVRLAIVIRGDLFASALMAELFVAMIALSVTMGLPWRTHVARLAQGLGVYSVFGILTQAAQTYFGSNKETYRLVSRTEIMLYLLCLCYWTITMTMKEPKPRKLPEQLHNDLRALQIRVALILRNLQMTGKTS